MFAHVLALCFILRLLKRSNHYAPKFIESHFGTEARADLRKLEKVMRKIEKRKLDIEFLRVCIIYRIFPNFLKFKLYKKIRQPINQVTALKKKLLSIELKGQRRRLTSLEKEKEVLKTKLFSQIGILSAITQKNFFQMKFRKNTIDVPEFTHENC